jgi:hypothetical protein
MKRLFRSLGVVVCLAAPVPARAQARTAVHILGRTASQQWKMDTALHLATDTVTLTFESGDGGTIYTVDFVAHHAPLKPVDLPGVVDIIVTQHPVEDDAPVMTLQVDGQEMPLVARPLGRRSVVASVPLADFVRLTDAGSIVDRTFNAELEFGPTQLRTLRAIADQWLGRKP